MTNAGWLGHDYIHGVDDFAFKLRNFVAAAAGLLPQASRALEETVLFCTGDTTPIPERRMTNIDYTTY
jgi:hypothetical protein